MTRLCECGCGQPTPLAKQTKLSRGNIKGQPQRFCFGHRKMVTVRFPRAEIKAWYSMRARCSDSTRADFKNYGGRGIRVCQEWLDSFPVFLAHVGLRPSADVQLDRIDNDGDYEPGNVRWATRSEQRRNQRRYKQSERRRTA